MRYVETNRTVEPHSESILYLYLQDANGAPVPNNKVKIWAGPPPTGQPPYFEDDDPNNPNRRTSADGAFQFVVANPAPDKPLDFFVQVLGPGNAPASDPIHFPFPAKVAQWVTVTAAPEGSRGGDGEIPPVPDLQLDPRLASEVNVSTQILQPTAGTKYWKLISAKYMNPDESGGNVTIVCYVQDESGHPLPGVRVLQRWPGDEAPATSDERGKVEFPMSGDSSFDPPKGQHGPYSSLVAGLPSDAVNGMGLPLRRHVQYILTWRRVTAGQSVVPPVLSAVTGQIRNAPAGTQLTLSGAGKTWTTTVGPDGTYGFTNLPAGTFALAVTGIGIVNGAITLDGKQAVVFDYAMPINKPQPTKVFTHYLLFGPGNQPGTMTNLILALDYIVRYAPIVGFSADEAKSAQRVTIVGDNNAVSTAVEQTLRDAGCTVVRLTAADSYALENLFKQLVASGSPYPR